MEEELAALRARIVRLEERADHLLELTDRVDWEAGTRQAFEDGFLMPLLFRMGADGFRDEMLRWLERLLQQERDWIADEGKPDRDALRLQYWLDLLRKREPWPDFPPDGWIHPREV